MTKLVDQSRQHYVYISTIFNQKFRKLFNVFLCVWMNIMKLNAYNGKH